MLLEMEMVMRTNRTNRVNGVYYFSEPALRGEGAIAL